MGMFDSNRKSRLFFPCFITFYILFSELHFTHNLNSEDAPTDILLCRQCGADISDATYLHDRFSPSALIKGNQTLFGKQNVQVQVLENPIGIRFQAVTLTKANCIGVDEWHNEYSWFPGFAWKYCVCRQCGHHLGWIFEPLMSAIPGRKIPSSKGFYVLILDNILSEVWENRPMNILYHSILPEDCTS